MVILTLVDYCSSSSSGGSNKTTSQVNRERVDTPDLIQLMPASVDPIFCQSDSSCVAASTQQQQAQPSAIIDIETNGATTITSGASNSGNSSRTTPKAIPTDPADKPILLHPILHYIPMQIRFGLAGTVSNVIFIIMYNTAISIIPPPKIAASTIYAMVYFIFIPISHVILSSTVFGLWPSGKYIASLMSNFPIGLSALMLGAAGTAYLDRIGFEVMAHDYWVRHYAGNYYTVDETDDDSEVGEFYSSFIIMTITGIWTYVLGVMVNTTTNSAEPHKKEA